MESQLHTLETKLAQLLEMTVQLRADNHQLRQDLAQLQSLHRVMGDNMDAASTRLQKILLSLPDDTL